MKNFNPLIHKSISNHNKPLCIIVDLFGTVFDLKEDDKIYFNKSKHYEVIKPVRSIITCTKYNISRVFILDPLRIDNYSFLKKWIENELKLNLSKTSYFYNYLKLEEAEFKRKMVHKIKKDYDIWFALDDNMECSKMYAEENIISLNLTN